MVEDIWLVPTVMNNTINLVIVDASDKLHKTNIHKVEVRFEP